MEARRGVHSETHSQERVLQQGMCVCVCVCVCRVHTETHSQERVLQQGIKPTLSIPYFCIKPTSSML
jgi:hypothetical protein